MSFQATTIPSSWVSIFELLKEPTLIFTLAVLGILGWVIYSLLKVIKHQVDVEKEHIGYERELLSEIGKNSETLARLTALIEILVHGRGGRS